MTCPSQLKYRHCAMAQVAPVPDCSIDCSQCLKDWHRLHTKVLHPEELNPNYKQYTL